MYTHTLFAERNKFSQRSFSSQAAPPQQILISGPTSYLNPAGGVAWPGGGVALAVFKITSN